MNEMKQTHVSDEKQNQLEAADRFRFERELGDTLQGRIYLVTDLITNEACVVKEAWKKLVDSKRSRTNCKVAEDFLAERRMILELSKNGVIQSLVHAIQSWDDDKCYFYAMELCDAELFDYVNNIHKNSNYAKLTENEALKTPQKAITNTSANEWISITQYMFKQIVSGLHWMHSHGFCHLDLSLENTMLSNVKQHKIKIIDFGLTKEFSMDESQWLHKGRVGKVNYMAPEVYNRELYDARLADVYCLGIILFMMLIGAPIYSIPHANDAVFNYMINGKLIDILKHWKRCRIVTVDAIDLLNKILTYQSTRITLEEILKHPFLTNTITIYKDEDDDDNHNKEDEKEANDDDDDVEDSIHGLDSDEDDDDADCELLLNKWGLKHCYPKLKESGWLNPNEWQQLTVSVLVYEIGLDKKESIELMQQIDSYLKSKDSALSQ